MGGDVENVFYFQRRNIRSNDRNINIFKKFPRSARLGAMFRKMTIPKKGKYVYMVGKLNVFPLRKLGGATAREPKREDATRAGDGAVARLPCTYL